MLDWQDKEAGMVEPKSVILNLRFDLVTTLSGQEEKSACLHSGCETGAEDTNRKSI